MVFGHEIDNRMAPRWKAGSFYKKRAEEGFRTTEKFWNSKGEPVDSKEAEAE